MTMRCYFMAYGKSGETHGVDFQRELPSIPHTGDHIFATYDGPCYIVHSVVLNSNDTVDVHCKINYDLNPYSWVINDDR